MQLNTGASGSEFQSRVEVAAGELLGEEVEAQVEAGEVMVEGQSEEDQ